MYITNKTLKIKNIIFHSSNEDLFIYRTSHHQYIDIEIFKSAFDGIQPTLRQVPPRVPLFSIQTVLRPFYAAFIAAT